MGARRAAPQSAASRAQPLDGRRVCDGPTCQGPSREPAWHGVGLNCGQIFGGGERPRGVQDDGQRVPFFFSLLFFHRGHSCPVRRRAVISGFTRDGDVTRGFFSLEIFLPVFLSLLMNR